MIIGVTASHRARAIAAVIYSQDRVHATEDVTDTRDARCATFATYIKRAHVMQPVTSSRVNSAIRQATRQ